MQNQIINHKRLFIFFGGDFITSIFINFFNRLKFNFYKISKHESKIFFNLNTFINTLSVDRK